MVSPRDLYSASIGDLDTMLGFLLDHIFGFKLKNTTIHDVDLRSSVDDA